MSRVRAAVTLVILTGLLATTPVVANAGPPAHVAEGRHRRAEVAFDRAVALFGGAAVPGPRDATLVLLDLARAVPDLPPAKARVARALLARPTDGGGDPFGDGYTVAAEHLCGADVCVHWVESTPDAVPLADDDLNDTPDYVDTAIAVLEDVWSFEVEQLGYRAPLGDSTSPDPGPGSELDVYLADVGADGFYGYCASDDPNATDPGYEYYDVSMYCVLDDDFGKAQFPGVYGTQALKVTAAHEFFHAVQAAYDAWEDPWLSEGTASWIEDELYDTINDNRQYLVRSPLSRPWVPTDRGAGGHEYGAWIFWRFLSESFNRSIVRDIWEYADGSASGPDKDSLRATRLAVEDRGRVFSSTFGDFGAWNAWPAARYEEGNAYAGPPHAARWGVTAANGGVPWTDLTLDHLTNRDVRFTPAKGVRSTAKLRVVVDGPSAAAGPAATVVIRSTSGVVKHVVVPLDAKGRGSRRVSFGKGVVAWADLVLTNASTRTRCWQGTRFSCQGDPRDDDVTFRYGAVLIP
ncbi:MAG TPA: MXAN_6640 family putative metalloprotease [Actinomycetota bacterium]